MKITKLMTMALLTTGLFSACSSDNNDTPTIEESKAVVFTSTITGLQNNHSELQSRMNGTAWNDNDEAGIFMLAGNNEMANKKYLAQPGGSLKAVQGNELKYPLEGTADFLAYYPYTSNATNKNVAISVAEQKNPAQIDFLYSNNAKGIKNEQTVNLQFAHQLSKIVINVKGDESVQDTKGLTIALTGMNTEATFHLTDGTLTAADSKSTIQMNVNAEGSAAEAIVLPAPSAEGMKLVFSLAGKTVEYPIVINENKGFEAGNKYTFEATLSIVDDQPKVQMGIASITDWIDKAGGNVDVDFGDEGGTTPDPTPNPNPNPNPDPEPQPEPVDGTILFNETFGEPQKNGKFWPTVNKYDGWTDSHNLTYSDPLQGTNAYSNANIRSTSTMDGHLWLTAGKDAALRIAGFDAKTYKTVQLTYNIAANMKGNQNCIKVSTDKGEITIPSVEITELNKYHTVTINLPNDFTYIQFTGNAATNTAGYRIDNVKVVGSTK